MMNPNFTYQDPSVEASKIAYDLSLIYAKVKFEEALRTGSESFSYGPASQEVEEAAFLEHKFMQAYEYYMGAGPGDFEWTLQRLRN